MFTKDRYSKTFLVMSGSALLSAYLYRNGKGNLAAAAFIPFIFFKGQKAFKTCFNLKHGGDR